MVLIYFESYNLTNAVFAGIYTVRNGISRFIVLREK